MSMIFIDLLEVKLLLVNGNYSNYLYLIQVKKAFDSYREKAIKN